MTVKRKKVPKVVALINADYCTGCEACIAVCPVSCIASVQMGLAVKGSQSWCEVDMARCIGCAQCVRVPRRHTNPYELTVCPWGAIEMVPVDVLPEAVLEMGGAPEYVQQHRGRLIAQAQALVQARAAQKAEVAELT